jgi:hypothetical protein
MGGVFRPHRMQKKLRKRKKTKLCNSFDYCVSVSSFFV